MPIQRKPREYREHEPTAAEREDFEEQLLDEDLEGAQLRAFAYAMKLTGKNTPLARQLVLQARTLLWERCSWDPEKVSLGAYLCSVVRNEWSNEARRAETERENEVLYLTEVETIDGPDAKSPEEMLLAHEESEEGREAAARRLEELKTHFESTEDKVNLDWIKFSLDGIDDLAEMARLSGRRVEEFYRARDRRGRYVERSKRKAPEKT